MYSYFASSFIPCGYRTQVTRYPKGVSGRKQVARLVAPPDDGFNAKPSVLLLWDSNTRNLVNPQVCIS